MRDLIQFVRQLWEDRLLSVEDFTKEHCLSLEEALKLRNKELEGCMKDLESQTDALLEALEEADSLLASPRRADDRAHRKLALGECLQRLGKQEEEALRTYDQEKVVFLRRARQLLIDSFQGDSPILSASSLVEDVPEATQTDEIVPLEEIKLMSEEEKVVTEEQIMQTDHGAFQEEVGTQTRAMLAKKIKELKKKTDQLAPKILQKDTSPVSPKKSPQMMKKKLKKKRNIVSPQYINERLRIRAPSPRRHKLPWETPSEDEGDDGYTSTDLSPAVPPQPNNSAASLANPSDDNLGFETADEVFGEQRSRGEKGRKKSKSPKRAKATKTSKSPKRSAVTAATAAAAETEAAATGVAAVLDGVPEPVPPVGAGFAPQLVAPEAAKQCVVDMGQGEGGRPRRRRSKSQRSKMKSAGAERTAVAGASSDEEEGERRRRTAEPHGDGGRPALSRRGGDGSPGRAERRPAVSPAHSRLASPGRRGPSPPTASQVFCLASVPQPADLGPAVAVAAAVQSDSKLLGTEAELGAKQRTAQPRPTRRKRCSGGGDTMSVQSFTSAEDGRGRGAAEAEPGPRQTRPTAAHGPAADTALLGAVGGDEAGGRAASGFRWETSHLVYQPDPFPGRPAAAAAASAVAPLPSPWVYRCHPRDLQTHLPPADGPPDSDKAQEAVAAAGDDSGFQSETAARGPPPPPSEPYVPPLPLPLLSPAPAPAADSAEPPPARPKSETDTSATGGSPRTPRSPSQPRLLASPTRQLERSVSCEVPTKKQRRADEEPAAPACPELGSGDQPAAAPPPPPSPPTQAAPLTSQSSQPLVSRPSADASPKSSPGRREASDSSEYRDCEGSKHQLQGSEEVVQSSGPLSPSLFSRDYEQLQQSLNELKELQTKFQKDFAANEHAKEASERLQSDIQRMESSIQELQGIVSQEYEQTRQDHEETRSAIVQIESRVEEGERMTQAQLDDLRARLEQIADKMSQLEVDLHREKKSLEEQKEEVSPSVMTLSSMLNRLETEVITLRHEVDSNRHSIDSITSVTQLDSPKRSPNSEHTNTDWQQTGRTDQSKSSAPPPDSESARTEQLPPAPPRSRPTAVQRSRPEDLDSFRDSNSDVSESEATALDADRSQQQGQEQPQPPQPPHQQQQQQQHQQHQPQQQQQPQRQRAAQPVLQQRRPAVVSPLRMVGGRRSSSYCRRHRPDVLTQLRQMHLMPAARHGARSRSAAPSVARDESDDSPLQECWAPDLSTASASTDAPRHNESTRVHHGSSRNASRISEERRNKSEAFLSKLDSMSNPSDKLDQLQQKLLGLRHRVLLSMYRRQRRRAVSEGPRHQQADQQRRRAQLAAIDRRLRQRLHGWNRRLLADAGRHGSSTGDVVSETSTNSREFVSDDGVPAPAAASQRAANEYLQQLSHMLAGSAQCEEARRGRDESRGRHRQRTFSPPTKDPSAAQRCSRRGQPATVSAPGAHLARFAHNESKLIELQTYLGGIRHHLQRMASELDSPPPRPAARPAPAAQGVVFAPWQRGRGRSLSSQRPVISLRW